MGKPKLYSDSRAHVFIHVTNVNDCPPVFKDREQNVTLFLPTFKNVFVTQIVASDADNDVIRYDIIDGNSQEYFQLHPITGVLTTRYLLYFLYKCKNVTLFYLFYLETLNMITSNMTYKFAPLMVCTPHFLWFT